MKSIFNRSIWIFVAVFLISLTFADLGHAGLKECFSDGKNPFTLENLTLRGAQLFHLFRERALSHEKCL